MEGCLRSNHRRCSIEKGVLKNLAQVFSCEFCEIFKNTFFTKHLRMTALLLLTTGEYVLSLHNLDANSESSCS